MSADISGFLQQLRFEVTRTDFNSAALQCEKRLTSQLENRTKVVKLLELGRWALAADDLLWDSNLSSPLFLCLRKDVVIGSWWFFGFTLFLVYLFDPTGFVLRRIPAPTWLLEPTLQFYLDSTRSISEMPLH